CLAVWLAASCGAAPGEDGNRMVAEISLELPPLEEVTRIRNLVWLEETGALWILNSGAPHLIKIDSAGRIITAFGGRGPGPNELGLPVAIAGAGEDWVDLLDHTRRSVRRFDLSGKEVHSRPFPEHQRSRVILELESTSYGDPYQVYFDDARFILLNFPAGLESTRWYWYARLDQVDRRTLQVTTIADFSASHESHLETLQDEGPASHPAVDRLPGWLGGPVQALRRFDLRPRTDRHVHPGPACPAALAGRGRPGVRARHDRDVGLGGKDRSRAGRKRTA